MHIVSEQHLLFEDKGGNQHVSAVSDVDWYLAPQPDLISFWKGLSKCQGVVVKTSRLLRSPGKTRGSRIAGLRTEQHDLLRGQETPQSGHPCPILPWPGSNLWDFCSTLPWHIQLFLLPPWNLVWVRIWARLSGFGPRLCFLCPYITCFGMNHCTWLLEVLASHVAQYKWLTRV